MPNATQQRRTLRQRRPLLTLSAALVMGYIAQASAAPVDVDIPAQSLDSALRALGTQTNLQILYSPDAIGNQRSTPVKGHLEPGEALKQLIRGTDVRYQIDGNTVTLIGAPTNDGAINLDTTAVNAMAFTQSTENSNSYTTNVTAVGSKVASSIKEVPHSVSVITRKEIEDRNLNNLTDVMGKMTGVTVQKAGISQAAMGGESNFFSRGFAVSNTTIDGGAPLTTSIAGFGSLSQLDMAQYDHVEFLRGIDGLYSSSGDPGGTINLVRKRALRENQLTFAASAGSWDNYRTELDVTGPLVDNGSIRGRLGVAYQDSKAFYDYGKSENQLTYGSLEFDLSPDTTLTVGGSYQDMDGVPAFGGLPRYTNGDDLKLPRHTALTANWNTTREKTTQLYSKLEHNFNPDWTLVTDVSLVDINRNSKGLYSFGGVDQETGLGPTWNTFPNTGGSVRKTFNTYLKGGFEAFDLHHDVLLGVDYTHSVGSVTQRIGLANGLPADWTGQTPPQRPDSFLNKRQDVPEIRRSAYGMTRLALTEDLKFIIGGRVANYSSQNRQKFYQTATESNGETSRETGVFTPYAGITYDLSDEWTAYTSYAETFTPQSFATDVDGKQLEPTTSKNYELGLKGQLYDGRMNTSLAIYRIEQKNAAAYDADASPIPGAAIDTCCYFSRGQVTSEGFDAEISGEVARGLQLMAGYTYNHSTEEGAGEARDSYVGITPKHLLKVWGTYQLPGELQDWKVGMGATSQSGTSKNGFVNGEAYKFDESGYTIWSAALDYKIDEHWSATINANNIFDKKYYATIGTTDYNNFYGDPRNFMLTIRSKF
ncbi:TonB-dependent siderophore receptor [Pseudomonas sichuanensis]|uniref:TonB-dependent siderophore receptor n=1 Tax=Pseudomonas TaxID=286 RepID=UPI0036F127A0